MIDALCLLFRLWGRDEATRPDTVERDIGGQGDESVLNCGYLSTDSKHIYIVMPLLRIISKTYEMVFKEALRKTQDPWWQTIQRRLPKMSCQSRFECASNTQIPLQNTDCLMTLLDFKDTKFLKLLTRSMGNFEKNPDGKEENAWILGV